MNIIEAQNLTKEYKRFKRFPGFWGGNAHVNDTTVFKSSGSK